jgi:hypothetical protein
VGVEGFACFNFDHVGFSLTQIEKYGFAFGYFLG